MILKNGFVMTEDFELKKLDVKISGEKITEIGANLEGDEVIDVTGKYVLPGFIDTHIHGAYGTRMGVEDVDYNKITTFEATQGVTSIAITQGSCEFEKRLRDFAFVRDVAKSLRGTKIVAIHAEGPFLSSERKGAMKIECFIPPENEKLDRMIEASGGLLKIMTIAPEVPGAEEVIRYAVEKGISVSLGHTNSDYDTAMAGIEAGATRLTHTFNAMRPLNHREPGVLGAGLTDNRVTCEAICDYVHLHPAVVKMIYDMKGADRISMVSDSGNAAGLNISEFEINGVKRYIKDGVVTLADGTIAGSASTLLNGVKNLVNSGIPLTDVSKMASANPAKDLKMFDEIGSISVGKLADIAVLDSKLDVACTFINGKCEYKSFDF